MEFHLTVKESDKTEHSEVQLWESVTTTYSPPYWYCIQILKVTFRVEIRFSGSRAKSNSIVFSLNRSQSNLLGIMPTFMTIISNKT